MKRTPLSRVTQIPPGNTPLSRRTPLTARAGLTTLKALARGDKPQRPPRNTGPKVATRNLVIERAGGCCERCGQAIGGQFSIHHRLPRGMGGTSDPAANSPANLVLLCGSATTGCHASVERFRQAAVTTGWIVPRGTDPAKTPLKTPGGWVLLAHDGTKTATGRPND